MVNGNEELIINLILKGEMLNKFNELKSKIGVGKPNTQVLKTCLEEAHKNLI